MYGLAIVVLVASCSGAPDRPRVTPAGASTPIPTLTYRLLSGEPWSTRDVLGQVVVLDVWATYCKPCRRSFPKLDRLAVSSSELTVIGVSVDEHDADVHRFLGEVPAGFLIARDPARTVEAAPLSIHKLPTVIVLDRAGRVRFRAEEMDEADYDELARVVAALLAE